MSGQILEKKAWILSGWNCQIWGISLRSYNLSLECSISKLKHVFSSSWEGLSEDKSFMICQNVPIFG